MRVADRSASVAALRAMLASACAANTSESSGSQSQCGDGNIPDAGANHSAAMGIYLRGRRRGVLARGRRHRRVRGEGRGRPSSSRHPRAGVGGRGPRDGLRRRGRLTPVGGRGELEALLGLHRGLRMHMHPGSVRGGGGFRGGARRRRRGWRRRERGGAEHGAEALLREVGELRRARACAHGVGAAGGRAVRGLAAGLRRHRRRRLLPLSEHQRPRP
eukprot:1195705-Prorocentrum_minimum.AAC.3